MNFLFPIMGQICVSGYMCVYVCIYVILPYIPTVLLQPGGGEVSSIRNTNCPEMFTLDAVSINEMFCVLEPGNVNVCSSAPP